MRSPEILATVFHPAVRGVYARRFGSDAAADRFLRADFEDAPEPTDLPGLDSAVDRIETALDQRERIAVFGHDDPDGITSAALVVETLETLGAPVDPYIPNRDQEGHGLYAELVRRFRARGATLLVTTDGCSSNRAEADLAKSLGLDLVVTDHHEIAPGRQPVTQLVNPKADPKSAARWGDLTGAGVAALVMRALLRRRLGAAADNKFGRILDLVALGTIADYADLSRNNRVLVVEGLSEVARGRRPALDLARRVLGIGPEAVLRVDKTDRLAAVFASIPSREGRSLGLDALLGRPPWAGATRELLEKFLADEKPIQESVEAAGRIAEREGMFADEPIVLVIADAKPRHLGKTATQLSERTRRPAAVLTEHREKLIGELRGPFGVDLVAILSEHRGLLESWGGHRTAAGFSADSSRAQEVLGRLREALAKHPAQPVQAPTAEADVQRADIDVSFSRSLRAAMPFGRGNPSPVFRLLNYRAAAQGPSTGGDESVDLMEQGFPDRAEDRTPLVTFLPKGRGGLVVRFEGWDTEGAR